MKKILLSGVKPTGRPHIGNYFGAMKQFVDLLKSNDYNCYFFLADYHALNLLKDADEMRRNSLDLAIDYMAIGLEPIKATIFKQSDVPAHTELCWIFDTLVTVPYLMRAHAFKDWVNKIGVKSFDPNQIIQSGEDVQNFVRYDDVVETTFKAINVGTFNYPVLMAADILLYGTDAVPVGQDQKQHVEYARDIALKFNNAFGETFKLPEPLILPNVAVVPGTDGQKMSKSYGNTIPLFASREEIVKAVMSIVTDSGQDVPRNVYAIHKLFRPELELKALYGANKGKYKALKEALIEDIDAFVKPLRERRAALAKDEAFVRKVLADGAAKANAVASAKLLEAKQKIGVI